MLAYRHAECAWVYVHIYIYVGRVYMSVHVYLHACMPNLHVCEFACVCVHVYLYTH